jgi:hypothetical protein
MGDSRVARRILQIDEELARAAPPIGKTSLFIQAMFVVSLILVGVGHMVSDPEFLIGPIVALGGGGLWGASIAVRLSDARRRRAKLLRELDGLLASEVRPGDEPPRALGSRNA